MLHYSGQCSVLYEQTWDLYSYSTTDFDPLSASVILTVIGTYYIAPTGLHSSISTVSPMLKMYKNDGTLTNIINISLYHYQYCFYVQTNSNNDDDNNNNNNNNSMTFKKRT